MVGYLILWLDLGRCVGLFFFVVDLRGLLGENFLRGSPWKDCGSVGGGRVGDNTSPDDRLDRSAPRPLPTWTTSSSIVGSGPGELQSWQ